MMTLIGLGYAAFAVFVLVLLFRLMWLSQSRLVFMAKVSEFVQKKANERTPLGVEKIDKLYNCVPSYWRMFWRLTVWRFEDFVKDYEVYSDLYYDGQLGYEDQKEKKDKPDVVQDKPDEYVCESGFVETVTEESKPEEIKSKEVYVQDNLGVPEDPYANVTVPTFGEALRRLRLASDIGSCELSTKIGLSKSSISSYETGRRKPESNVIGKIEKTLGVPRGVLELVLLQEKGLDCFPEVKAMLVLEINVLEHDLKEKSG